MSTGKNDNQVILLYNYSVRNLTFFYFNVLIRIPQCSLAATWHVNPSSKVRECDRRQTDDRPRYGEMGSYRRNRLCRKTRFRLKIIELIGGSVCINFPAAYIVTVVSDDVIAALLA